MAVALSNSQLPYAAPIAAPQAQPRVWAAGDTALGKLAFATLWIFVFVMPWEESVPLWGGFVISRWVALVAVSLLVLAVLATRRLRRPCALHTLMLAFVAWSAVTLFWTIDSLSTQTRVGTYSQLLLAVWMMWELATTEDRVRSLLQAYVMGATVLCVSTIINYSLGIQASDLAAEQGIVKSQDFRYTMYGINANDLALMVAISLPLTAYLLLHARSRLLKLYCWLYLGIALTTLFLVGSRGGLIAATAGLMLFPLLMSRMGRLPTIGFVLVCAIGIGCGVYFVPNDVWKRLLATGTEITQGTMTHRTSLWDAGFEAFRDHVWSGVGSGAYATAIYKAAGIALVAHNTFISVLVEMGIPGFLLFAALLAAIFYTAWSFRGADRRFWIVTLLTWSIGVAALTWEYRKPTWFLFGLLVAHAYARRDARS